MRYPSKSDVKRALWSSFKAIAATTIVLNVVVFSPVWNWSGHPRPSVEVYIAHLLIMLAVLTPVLLLTALVKEVSDNQAA